MSKTERRRELLRRGGIDPIRADTRPISEIMNDRIPYDRWERELNLINRMGYPSWEALLKNGKKKRKSRHSKE